MGALNVRKLDYDYDYEHEHEHEHEHPFSSDDSVASEHGSNSFFPREARCLTREGLVNQGGTLFTAARSRSCSTVQIRHSFN